MSSQNRNRLLIFVLLLFLNGLFTNISAQKSSRHYPSHNNIKIKHNAKDSLRKSYPIRQRECGTMLYHQYKIKTDKNYFKNYKNAQKQIDQYLKDAKNIEDINGIVTIPVVIHVVYKTNEENIPDSRIMEQLQVLNRDYRNKNADGIKVPAPFQQYRADIGIEFCLAAIDPDGNPTNGIIRTQTTKNSFTINDDVKFNSSGGCDAWNSAKYLNIWVCNLEGNYMGFAQFPGGAPETDGLVVDYEYFGVSNTLIPYNEGRTTVHEAAHLFDLYHIWGDDETSGDLCSGTDYCDDTPNQALHNFGCPKFPKLDMCTPSGNGVMFNNYMDYVDDSCMLLFTHNQAARIMACINTVRSELKNSNVCGNMGDLDTLNFPLAGDATLYSCSNQNGLYCGYSNGNNCFGDMAKAEKFTIIPSYKVVKGALLWFGYASNTNNTEIKVNIWSESVINKTPDTIIAQKIIAIQHIIDDINNNRLTYIEFDKPVEVGSNFYVGIALPKNAGDTVALVSNRHNQTLPCNAWELLQDNKWYAYTQSWNDSFNIRLGIFPIVKKIEENQDTIVYSDEYKVYFDNSTDKVVIEGVWRMKSLDIEMFDIMGNQVFTGNYANEAGYNMITFAVPMLRNGIYFVRFKSEIFNRTKKILIFKTLANP